MLRLDVLSGKQTSKHSDLPMDRDLPPLVLAAPADMYSFQPLSMYVVADIYIVGCFSAHMLRRR